MIRTRTIRHGNSLFSAFVPAHVPQKCMLRNDWLHTKTNSVTASFNVWTCSLKQMTVMLPLKDIKELKLKMPVIIIISMLMVCNSSREIFCENPKIHQNTIQLEQKINEMAVFIFTHAHNRIHHHNPIDSSGILIRPSVDQHFSLLQYCTFFNLFLRCICYNENVLSAGWSIFLQQQVLEL